MKQLQHFYLGLYIYWLNTKVRLVTQITPHTHALTHRSPKPHICTHNIRAAVLFNFLFFACFPNQQMHSTKHTKKQRKFFLTTPTTTTTTSTALLMNN